MSFDNNEEYKYDHLEELSGSDYEIVDGEPDIKNWDVKTEQGVKIGEVKELLFAPEARKVRYLIVQLEDSQIDVTDGKSVLIPIGVAKLYSDDKDLNNTLSGADNTATVYSGSESGVYNPVYDGDVVIVPVTAEQLVLLPGYVQDNVTPITELTIRQVFEGTVGATQAYDRNGFYDHDYFDVDSFYDRGATTRSILPVTEEDSLDEPIAGESTTEGPITKESPFDSSIDPDKTGRGGINAY